MQESIILFSEISSQHKVLKENADLFCENPDKNPSVHKGGEAHENSCESTVQEDILFTEADVEEVVKDNDNKEWYRIQVQDKEVKKKGYIKKEELKEISAHNWIDFGFTIRKIYFNQFILEETDKFLKMIWDQLEKEGEPDKKELGRALKEQVMSRKLSKLICYHSSEWGIDFSQFKTEVEAFYDRRIAEASSKVKKQLEENKKAKIEELKTKIEKLNFWDQVNIAPVEQEEKTELKIESVSKSESKAESKNKLEAKSKEEKQVLVPFPTSPKVYHFHPIAFVEQMKLMNTSLVYDIYHTGRIVESGNYEKAKKAQFIYHDKNGNKHVLGTWKLINMQMEQEKK